MTDLTSPQWVIRFVESGESIPGETFTIFVAEDDSGDGRHFDLQCMLSEPSAQNVRLELDSYCIVNEAGGVHYGGLEEVSLLPENLILRFRDDAVEELELSSNVVTLGIDPTIDVEEVRAGLRKVLSYGNPHKVPNMNL
ncbi:Imm10 family immunity protein [Streptomyces microflavus]|uniref:Imm10 family immunity protein n=1 Tax=Streptomyces microflavus TaxID=1919 RepID=UPI0037F1B8EC